MMTWDRRGDDNHLTTITAAKDWPGILMKVNKTSSTYSHWYRSELGKCFRLGVSTDSRGNMMTWGRRVHPDEYRRAPKRCTGPMVNCIEDYKPDLLGHC